MQRFILLLLFAGFTSLVSTGPAFARSLADLQFKNMSYERDQIIADLQFLSTVRGPHLYPATAKLGKILGPTLDGARIIQFFLSNVKTIEINNDLCPQAIACSRYGGGTIYITERFFEFADDNDAARNLRLHILLHESYHIYTYSPHVYCGKTECDKTIEGGYGFSALIFFNIAKFCSNCDDSVQWMAGEQALEILEVVKDEDLTAVQKECPPGYLNNHVTSDITRCSLPKKRTR